MPRHVASGYSAIVKGKQTKNWFFNTVFVALIHCCLGLQPAKRDELNQ